jgi:prolyl-tRNA synthetase
LQTSIVEVNSIEEFNQVIKDKKIAKAPWGGNPDDEKTLKEQTGATPRCIANQITSGTCFFTKKPAHHVVYFARAY